MILPTLRSMLLGALGAIIVIALWPTPKVTTRVTATTDPIAHVHGSDGTIILGHPDEAR